MKNVIISFTEMIDPVLRIVTDPTTWTTVFGVGAAAFAGFRVSKRSTTAEVENLHDQLDVLSLSITTIITNNERIVQQLEQRIDQLTKECLELRTNLLTTNLHLTERLHDKQA